MNDYAFNPNDIGRINGNYFGLPYSIEESKIALISVPWDVTTSYTAGTMYGPHAIIEASVQVDLFDFDVKDAWKIRIGSIELHLTEDSSRLRELAEEVIVYLKDGGSVTDKKIARHLSSINRGSERVNSKVYTQAKQFLDNGKIAAVIGGEHSVPFGLIKAITEKYSDVGILHIDAHADLRNAYEGFEYSHASIMHNVIHKCAGINKLVQVGIRDLSGEEFDLIQQDLRIVLYSDYALKEAGYNGKTWAQQCNDIVANLPQHVYISFDIDGLSPEYCPSTGTPVPGGLSFNQAVYLLKTVALSGRKIVGFDLCEVTPGESGEWDANVGARVLFKLCCYTYLSNNRIKT
ncbi:MAG: agmatinase family protein [Prevotellaceae bacterium]|jgi:agmatinase|nr:agmatinase family protein [Prevotellaceae bacterium]